MEFDVPITEITFADADRVDGVHGPANGVPFLMIKGTEDGISEMLKAISDDETLTDEQAFTKAAHAYDRFCKATFTQDERDKAAKAGEAMPDGSYVIQNGGHLDDAIKAVGRGNDSHDAIRQHIAKRAKALGQSDKIPETWGADGSLKKAEACKTCGGSGKIMDGKRDCPDCDGPMEKADAMAAAASEADALIPGSPTWEGIDAAGLDSAAQMLVSAVANIKTYMTRENIEVAAGEDSDWMDVAGAFEAIEKINHGLGIVCRLALGERGETMEKAGKRLSGKSVAHVATARDKASEMATHASALAQHLTGLLGEDDPANAEDADKTRAAKELDEMDAEELKKMLDESNASLLTAVGTLVDDKLAKAMAPKDDGDGSGDTEDGDKKPKEEVMGKSAEDVMAKAVETFTGIVTDALAPFEKRLAAIESEPQHGGPILNADAAAGSPLMKALSEIVNRGNGTTDGTMSKGQSELAELTERFTKAQSDEDREGIAIKAGYVRLRDGIEKPAGALV